MFTKKRRVVVAFLVLVLAVLLGITWYNKAAVSKGDRAKTEAITQGQCMDAKQAASVTKDANAVNEEVVRSEEPLADLSVEIKLILTKGKQALFAKYPIDESFFMWLSVHYGDAAIKDLAGAVQKGENDVRLWSDYFEKSIHVLWMEYCRDWNYSSYLLRTVNWIECRDSEKVTLDFIGDINFDENWCTTTALDERGGDLTKCFDSKLLQELQSADIAIANNEFTYSKRGSGLEGKPCVFRADPKRVEYLKEMGIDLVSVANNHIYDYGEEAFLDSLDTLTSAGISYVGAGKNLDEAKAVSYFIANGKKIAIVAATQIERYFNYTKEATKDTPGVLKTLDPELFVEVIKEAKSMSDYVIAYVHWGSEGMLYQDEDQRYLATCFAEAGADVIIGGHSHRLQGVGYIENVPVLYSLGNFWFSTGDIYTAIAQVCIEKDGTLTVGMLPCRQKNLTTCMLAEKQHKDAFYQYVADISEYTAIDEMGRFFYAEDTTLAQNVFPYSSGQSYSERTGAYDLDGNRINIIGNIVE